MKEIKLPDGKTAQFPKNTPDEVLHSFAKDYIDNNLNNQTPEQQPQQLTPISRGEAFLETATNIPFAPRIKAALAAGGAKLVGVDEPIGNLYNEALQDKLGKLDQARTQYPVQSIASEIASGIPLSATKVLATTKGLVGAVAMGGAQAIGETKDLTDFGDVLEKGGTAGVSSAGTYVALKGLGKIYNKVFNKGQVQVKKMTADEVKNMANVAYKAAEKKGGTLNELFINNLEQKANQLDKQTPLGRAISGQTAIGDVKTILEQFKNQKLNLQSLQELDEALGDKIDNFVENGRITKEGLPLLKLQNHLRDLVDNVTPNMVENSKEGFEALNQGRQFWAKSSKLRDIEKIITRAEMSDNPATALKTGFRTLFNNENKLKYFNKEEQKLIKKAAESGFITDSLRVLGSKLIPIGSVIAGGGLPSTMAGLVTNVASRNLASKAQLIKAEKLAEAIITGKTPMPKKPDSLLQSVISQKIGANSVYEKSQPQQ